MQAFKDLKIAKKEVREEQKLKYSFTTKLGCLKGICESIKGKNAFSNFSLCIILLFNGCRQFQIDRIDRN